jgi:LPXTG-motif cell wall-anchored protein
VRRTRLVASLAVAGAASATVLMLAGPAAAYPPHHHGHHARLSSYDPHRGGHDTGSGGGMANGEGVFAYLHSVRVFVGSTTANSAGVATVSFTIPADFPLGAHTFELVGQTSGHVDSVPFTVAAGTNATPASSGSTLPFTGGSDVWQMTVAGAALVAVGGSLLVVRRRRTHPAAV